MSLILHLPNDAALWREMTPGAEWTMDHELLATIAERVDVVAGLVHMHAGHFVKAHSKNAASSWPDWKRLEIQRPHEQEPEPESGGMSPLEFFSMFNPNRGDE